MTRTIIIRHNMYSMGTCDIIRRNHMHTGNEQCETKHNVHFFENSALGRRAETPAITADFTYTTQMKLIEPTYVNECRHNATDGSKPTALPLRASLAEYTNSTKTIRVHLVSNRFFRE